MKVQRFQKEPNSEQLQSIRSPTKANRHHRKSYQPDHIPPDWEFAQIHGKSVRPGFSNPNQFNFKCPCCLNTINKKIIPYCEDNKQLAFLGEGFPLIYNFLKYCIIMLGAVIINQCALSIFLNLQDFVCFTPKHVHSNSHQTRLLDNAYTLPTCQGTPFNHLAYLFTGNTGSIRQILNIISFVTHIVILLYFRQQQSSLADYLDERNTTISDFSVFIKQIPIKNSQNKKKLEMVINKLCPDVRIMEILIIENLQEYYKLQKQLDKIVEQKKKALTAKNFNEQKLIQIMAQHNKKEEQIEELTQKMQSQQQKYFKGTAFVILNSQFDRNLVIQAINNSGEKDIIQIYPNCIQMQKNMRAQHANEPNQINWENVHFTRKQRNIAIIFSWLVYSLLLGGVMTVYFLILDTKTKRILYIQHLKEETDNIQQQIASARILGYFLVIIINFLNKFVLSWIAHKLSDLQRHILYTDLQFSFALKYMLGMFFTTALMTLMVEAGIQSNYSDTLGVIQEQSFMFMFNAIFSPLVWLINPYNIIREIKKKIYYGSNNLTQKEANQIMELYPYDIGKRYAENMKTMWLTFLYIQMIPIGAVFSFVGVVLYYVVDKYVLLRRSSVKQEISANLSSSMITILQFTLVLKPLGQIIFSYQLYGQIAASSIVMITIGVVFMFLPLKAILKYVFQQRFQLQQKTYQEIKDTFTSNYISCYPLRKQQTYVKKKKNGTSNFLSQKNLDIEHPIIQKVNEDLLKSQQTKNRLMSSPVNDASSDRLHK